MAKAYITEYTNRAQDGNNQFFDGGLEPPVAEPTPVVIGAGSLQSAAFNANTTIVRVHVDAICSIAFGTNPTATVNTRRMAANATEYFGVPKGQSFKLAVIANT